MGRNKPIPSEVLRMAEQGEVEALRRLGRLILPGNATEAILEILFKWIIAIPVPVCSVQMSKFVSSSGIGDRPSVALCAFWKILQPLDYSEMRPEVKLLLIEHLIESGDAVFGWTRACLQSGLPTVTEDMLNTGPFSPRAKSYLSAGHMLSRLVRLDEDYTSVVLSSPAFINLCLELWLAEDYRDYTGKLAFRMLDCRAVFGCPTLEMVDKILSNYQSREILLARCKNNRQRERFAAALTDRAVRGWHHTKTPMLAWHYSLKLITSITAQLSNADPLSRRQFARTGHATQLCAQLKEFVTGLLQTEETKFLVSEAVSDLSTLMHLALNDDTPSRIRNNWNQLKEGCFVEALWGAMLIQAEGDEFGWLDTVLVIIGNLAQCMTHPPLFGDKEFPEIAIEKLDLMPKTIQPWTRLLEAHSRSAKAFSTLKRRPAVYFCDYLPCALSGKEMDTSSNKCSGCSSVVYCSPECQIRDWDEGHSEECHHAQAVHADRRASHTWYSHRNRASQAALLEVIYREGSDNAEYNARTTYPTFDCSSPETALEIKASIKEIPNIRPSSSDTQLKLFPQTRLGYLKEVYRSGSAPEGWRLAECVFPPVFGDNVPIGLVSLLKPVDDGYRTAFCVAQYRHDLSLALGSGSSIALSNSSATSR